MSYEDFDRLAGDLCRALEDAAGGGRGLGAGDIPGLLARTWTGGPFNCYPGEPGTGCTDAAFFVSLSSKKYAAGRGHLSFGGMLECFVRHMQGYCMDYTHAAVMIADSWDANAFEKWEPNIKQVSKTSLVLAYVISGGKYSRINL